MSKLHFTTDAFNRLVIGKGRSAQSVEGEFEIERSTLTFSPSLKPPLVEQLKLPKKMQFRGSWRLDKDHSLELLLSKTSSQYKNDVLTLRGKII